MLRKIIRELCIYALIIIIGIFATSIYYYVKLPVQAVMTLPGKMFSATELIEHLPETSLHGLSVTRIITEDRKEFIQYMWHQKRLYLDYTYVPYSTPDDLLEKQKADASHSIELEFQALNSLEAYTANHYAKTEQEAVEVLAPLTWYDDYSGDSATLLIMLALIAHYENKPWFNDDTKIAITASMDADGNVLPVGSVNLKMITAKMAKADILIVPKVQLEQAKKFSTYFWRPLTIVGVETIDETIEWLDENVP